MSILHAMAEALIKYETIDSDQIDDLMNGKTPRPPADWDEPESKSGGTGGAEVTEESPKKDKGEDTIGGPAGQH
jgi:cell division protease FtsH